MKLLSFSFSHIMGEPVTSCKIARQQQQIKVEHVVVFTCASGNHHRWQPHPLFVFLYPVPAQPKCINSALMHISGIAPLACALSVVFFRKHQKQPHMSSTSTNCAFSGIWTMAPCVTSIQAFLGCTSTLRCLHYDVLKRPERTSFARLEAGPPRAAAKARAPASNPSAAVNAGREIPVVGEGSSCKAMCKV